ncbi:MAG: twin-arginine translocase TatA/TatE family subunit [Dehalococcoidia bacterium]
MNLFGVGPLELIVVLVVALIFVGPERLPRLAADLARTIREIRRYTGQFAAEFNDVVRDLERETTEERTQWKEIGEGLSGAAASVTEALREARSSAAGDSAPPPPSPSANGHAPEPPGDAQPATAEDEAPG